MFPLSGHFHLPFVPFDTIINQGGGGHHVRINTGGGSAL